MLEKIENIPEFKYFTEKIFLRQRNHLHNYRPLDHTMGYNLDKYVAQRIPIKLIEYAVSNNLPIRVLGIFPDHFRNISLKLKLKILKDYDQFSMKKTGALNRMRPGYFLCCNNKGRKFLVVSVSPGSDYITHYASMIRHQVNLLSTRAKDIMSILYFPFLEREITEWTGLSDYFVQKGETVILGYVDEIEQSFKSKTDIYIEYLGSYENCYYRSRKYVVGNKIVNFLGVKYSFWGNLSGLIVNKCCALGAKEIIYAAKLGALSSPKHLYNKLFSVTNYVLMRGAEVIEHIRNLPNPFIEIFEDCHTLTHLSVPTVLEEDFIQRNIASEKFGVNSIDNEIFYMAKAVSDFVAKTNGSVDFFSLHFATDYIRQQNEVIMKTQYDLTNNRTKAALQSKSEAIANLAQKLILYLLNEKKCTFSRRAIACY